LTIDDWRLKIPELRIRNSSVKSPGTPELLNL
jgi:hypothetical protein